MKALWNPLGLMFLALGIGGAAFGRPEAAVVGIGAYIVLLIASTMRLTKANRDENWLDKVSNDNRARLMPLNKLKREIDEIVRSNSRNAVVKVIGSEAIADSNRLLEQAVRLLNSRDVLRKALSTRSQTDIDIAKLDLAAQAAQSDPERQMLKAAIEARREELKQLDLAEGKVEAIDANLAQAVAALGELKTRLALAASGSSELDHEDMRESIARLESLSETFEEAESVMGVRPVE